MWVQSLDWDDLLEKELTTHSSILAWEIPWAEESGRLSPRGCKRAGLSNYTTNILNLLKR